MIHSQSKAAATAAANTWIPAVVLRCISC
jgi:hypothetical protein